MTSRVLALLALIFATQGVAQVVAVDQAQGATLWRGGHSFPLRAGSPVVAGDLLQTEPEGRLVLTMSEHAAIALGGGTDVVAQRVPYAAFAKDLRTTLQLRQGSLRVVVVDGRWPVEVDLGGQVGTLAAGEFFFDHGKLDSRVCIAEGHVTLGTAQGMTRGTLPAGGCYTVSGAEVGARQTVAWAELRERFTLVPGAGPAPEPLAQSQAQAQAFPAPQAPAETTLAYPVPPPVSAAPSAPVQAAPEMTTRPPLPEPEPALAPPPVAQAPPVPPAGPPPVLRVWNRDLNRAIVTEIPDRIAQPAPPRPPALAAPPLRELAYVPAPPQIPPAARPPIVAPEDTAAPSGGIWAVNFGSFTSRTRAELDLRRLRSQGHTARIVSADVKGQTWYRVQVPGYPTQPAAEAAAAQLSADFGQGGVWVLKAP